MEPAETAVDPEELVARLAEADPAAAPPIADEVAALLAAELDAGGPDEESA